MGDKIKKSEFEAAMPRKRRSSPYVEYICSRCKTDMDPDENQCVACGNPGRPVRRVGDD